MPANDPPRTGIHDQRQMEGSVSVEKPGRVRRPELVRLPGVKIASHPIRNAVAAMPGPCGHVL